MLRPSPRAYYHRLNVEPVEIFGRYRDQHPMHEGMTERLYPGEVRRHLARRVVCERFVDPESVRITVEQEHGPVKRSDFVVQGPAVEFLVEHGYDAQFGARPLKRAIQKYIEDPLSEKILLGEFSPGDEIEVIVGDDGQLNFRALSGSKA